MRLWELFEDITPADIKDIERKLDHDVYQPADKLKKNQPVLDLDLPTGNSHFMQRIQQRNAVAKITPQEIEALLARAKLDPKLGFAGKLDALSKEEDPDTDIVLQDPRTKLTIPAIVKPNTQCVRSTDGNPVCLTRQGKEPKNKIVAKTIFRKGVEDEPAPAAPQRKPVVVQRQGFRR
jgi:hypothetical protein